MNEFKYTGIHTPQKKKNIIKAWVINNQIINYYKATALKKKNKLIRDILVLYQ